MNVLSVVMSALNLKSRRPAAVEDLIRAQAEAYGLAWDESRWASPTREMHAADRTAIRAAANDARYPSRRNRAGLRVVA